MDNVMVIGATVGDGDDTGSPDDFAEYLEFPGGRVRVSEGTPADLSGDAVQELVTPLATASRVLEPA
jgi:hypothetical protein